MSGRAGLLTANALLLAGAAPAWGRFRAALARPQAAQERVLALILAANAGSAYGRRWGFAGLRTPREYQDAVPVASYEDLAPWIERVMAGEQAVLTGAPVLMLEKTSGSAGPSKYIPYTAALRAQFQAAVSAWLFDLYARRPALLTGGAYWSVSPAAGPPEVTAGGLPVGFEDDTGYFDPLTRWVLTRQLLVPRGVCRIPDVEAWRYTTLRFLVASPRLAFVSVWNPSFLSLLARALPAHTERLVQDVRDGTLRAPAPLPEPLGTQLRSRLAPDAHRAAALAEAARAPGGLQPAGVWPGLRLISCWTGAAAAQALPDMQALFPGVEVQGKGLLATEGVVTIPLLGRPGAVPALTSHFLEFADPGRPDARPLLVDELAPGHTYSVLLTTGGGLYRYPLYDGVSVVGRERATPLLEFVGRTDRVSDLRGEKLSETRVADVLERVLATAGLAGAVAALAPAGGDPPYYELLLAGIEPGEAQLDRLAAAVEEGLAEGHHYAYCRRLGQLGPVRPRHVGPHPEAFLALGAARGQRLGDVKHAYLLPGGPSA